MLGMFCSPHSRSRWGRAFASQAAAAPPELRPRQVTRQVTEAGGHEHQRCKSHSHPQPDAAHSGQLSESSLGLPVKLAAFLAST